MKIRLQKTLLITGVVAGLLVFTIASASSARISKSMPGSVNINVISIQEMADVDGNGIVDHLDLQAVAGAMGTQPVDSAREDVNRDGVVDVLDLALVARYIGREVEA